MPAEQVLRRGQPPVRAATSAHARAVLALLLVESTYPGFGAGTLFFNFTTFRLCRHR